MKTEEPNTNPSAEQAETPNLEQQVLDLGAMCKHAVSRLENTFNSPQQIRLLLNSLVFRDALPVLNHFRSQGNWGSYNALTNTIRCLALYFLATQGEKNPELLRWNLTAQATQEELAVARAKAEKEQQAPPPQPA